MLPFPTTKEKQKLPEWEERKRKVKVKAAVSLLNPKAISKCCFLHMSELRKLRIVLHLDQKAVKCIACKQLCCKF